MKGQNQPQSEPWVRTEAEWIKMEEEISRLKKENEELKRLLALESSNEIRKSLQPDLKLPAKRQFQSYKEEPSSSKGCEKECELHHKDSKELKKEWEEWSNRLEASIASKYNRVRHHTEFEDIRKTAMASLSGSTGSDGFGVKNRKSLESLKEKKLEVVEQSEEFEFDIKVASEGEIKGKQSERLKLIEDVFLFGPSVSDIENSPARKFIADHQLYLPEEKSEEFEVYGNYLFPNDLEVRHIRGKNEAVEVNKMIFKNNKKLDYNIFVFQGQHESNSALREKSELLERVNPSKWMYALSIEFADFISVRNPHIHEAALNRTMSNVNEASIANLDSPIRVNNVNLSQKKSTEEQEKEQEPTPSLFKSNFCLCLMTYFPFIRFLKDLLVEVFDSVKLKRMGIMEKSQSFAEIDIRAFMRELEVELSKILEKGLNYEPKFEEVHEISVGLVELKLDLTYKNLISEIVGDWGFKIMKLFDKETLLDIFCYILMEESICFVCEDKNVLTFAILLYVVIFTLPFGYPHPCVSVIFNEELLETPFTSVLGVNKGTRWIEDNLQFLTQNKENKVIVNLNEEVKIRFNKKPRTHKTERLKKIFTNFYRKIETSALPSIFKKKMDLGSRETTKEENESVYQLVSDIHSYYHEEIMAHLPNREIIEMIKQNIRDEADENAVYNKLSEKIEKYFAESRRSKGRLEKEGFVDALTEKQIFRVFTDRVYQLR